MPKLSRDRALGQHNWAGFVRKLIDEKKYAADFQFVFGVDHPTQDTVAQALATYMRTILSGDSLYDRAADPMRKSKDARKLTEDDFRALLDKKDAQEKLVAVLPDEPEKVLTRTDLSAIAQGYALFSRQGGLCGVPRRTAVHGWGLSQRRLRRNRGGARHRHRDRASGARADRTKGIALDRGLSDADLAEPGANGGRTFTTVRCTRCRRWSNSSTRKCAGRRTWPCR